MSKLPWLTATALGGIYMWIRSAKQPLEALTGSWVWPIPQRDDGRKPKISDGYYSSRPGVPLHGGVDIMYPREAHDIEKPGTPNGTRMFVMPENTLVVAASEGVVKFAAKTSTGWAVVIDHAPRGVQTFYAHLEMVFVERKQRVKAGEMLGVVGANPLDAQKLKHLHFEVWQGASRDKIDPGLLMYAWPTVRDNRRNGSLTYRAIGAPGEAYPQWVRDLDGKAGVYVIREAGGPVLYVGSSRTQLYATLTRHFQGWTRWKTFWKDQYSEHDPGVTYERDGVEVAVRVTKASEALDEEMRLIRRLKPRDNVLGRVEAEEEVPF